MFLPFWVIDALQLNRVLAKRALSAMAGSFAVASWREELGSRGAARAAETTRKEEVRRRGNAGAATGEG
jgi:predicted nucleic acid-binding Zn ribbon protein